MTSTLNASRYKGHNHIPESTVVTIGTSNRPGFFFFQGFEVQLTELIVELERIDSTLVVKMPVNPHDFYILSA